MKGNDFLIKRIAFSHFEYSSTIDQNAEYSQKKHSLGIRFLWVNELWYSHA